MNELDFQAILIKSAKNRGGHGRKISSRFQLGIPDLLIAMAPFCPVIIEAKWLGEVKPKFNREIPTTKPQRDTLEKYNDVYGGELRWGFVITGFFMGKEMWASMTYGGQLRIKEELGVNETRIKRVSAESGFELGTLFYAFDVPRIV